MYGDATMTRLSRHGANPLPRYRDEHLRRRDRRVAKALLQGKLEELALEVPRDPSVRDVIVTPGGLAVRAL